MNNSTTKPCKPNHPSECLFYQAESTCPACGKDNDRKIWSWVFDMGGCILSSDGAEALSGHLDEDLIGDWTQDLIKQPSSGPRLFGRSFPLQPLTARQRILHKNGEWIETIYVALPIICKRTGALKGYRGASECITAINNSEINSSI